MRLSPPRIRTGPPCHLLLCALAAFPHTRLAMERQHTFVSRPPRPLSTTAKGRAITCRPRPATLSRAAGQVSRGSPRAQAIRVAKHASTAAPQTPIPPAPGSFPKNRNESPAARRQPSPAVPWLRALPRPQPAVRRSWFRGSGVPRSCAAGAALPLFYSRYRIITALPAEGWAGHRPHSTPPRRSSRC